MAIHVTWPSTSNESYEITVEADTGDHAKKLAAGTDEFDRFEELTRRLVAVPKGELVEKRSNT